MRDLASCSMHIPSPNHLDSNKTGTKDSPSKQKELKAKSYPGMNPRVLQRTDRLLEEGPAAMGVAL